MSPIGRRRFPVVLSAPSGAGKTTLARTLVERADDFGFSVSATTRPMRPGEVDGRDYHFVDAGEFEAMVSRGELAEWAEVHDRRYGTPRSELVAAAERGDHIVLDIDVQGARQIRAAVPEALLIFILPPSVEALLERLHRRGTEGPGQRARRLGSALSELDAVSEFDYVVVNDDLERCAGQIEAIVRAETLRTPRAAGLQDEVEAMRTRIAEVLEDEDRYTEQRRNING